MAVTGIFTTFVLGDTEYPDNGTDYNYQNMSDSPLFTCEEEDGHHTFDAVIQPLLYSFIFLLGVVGNSLMITILLKRQRHLRITEIYLFHLALADLMLLLTFPFTVADHVADWLFGEFLCRMVGLLKHLNLLCGSFLLACIGFDRYLAIVHAIPSMRNRRPRVVHITCTALWLVCLALSLPNCAFLTVKKENTSMPRRTCDFFDHELHGHNWVLTNNILTHISFFLPLAIMSYCYTAVVVTLCRSQKNQAKKGAIRLALLITLVFCFCWLPYNITLLIYTLVDLEVIRYDLCEPYITLQTTLDLTHGLGLGHCCLNPFLYAFVGVQFRRELHQMLSKLGCSCICLPFVRRHSHGRPSTSEGTTTISSTM